MRRIAIAVLALASIGIVERVEARNSSLTLSGAKLLEACTRADMEWISFCNGYLQAAFDATGGKGVCPPRGATRNDFYDVVIPVLKQMPELQKMNAVGGVIAALRKAYPCN